jgi:hypothetical protein
MNALKSFLAAILLSGWAIPPEGDAKRDVEDAFLKLSASENFSWVATTFEETEGKDPQLTDTVEGKWARGGWCQLSRPKTKKTTDAILKDDRIAVLVQEGWKIMDVKDLAPAAGKPDKAVLQAQRFLHEKSPLLEAKFLLGRVEDLGRRENGLYSGRLASLDVPLVLERAQAAGHKLPAFEEPKARVNFRIEDGVLSSFELVVSGRVLKAKKGQIVESLIAMAVDFSEVGKTALEIPEEARKLLE